MFNAIMNLIFLFVCFVILAVKEKPIFCGILYASLFIFRHLIYVMVYEIDIWITFFSIVLLYLSSICYFWLINKFPGTSIAGGLILAGILWSVSPLK